MRLFFLVIMTFAISASVLATQGENVTQLGISEKQDQDYAKQMEGLYKSNLPTVTVIKAAGTTPKSAMPVGDFLRWKDGSLMFWNQAEATKKCAELGSRLPTMQELLEDAVARGTGLVLISVQNFNSGKFPSGFTKDDFSLISEKYSDGSEYQIYYSFKNYVRPNGDLGNYWFRSSSLHPTDGIGAAMFSGYFGTVDFNGRNYENTFIGTRCVLHNNRLAPK